MEKTDKLYELIKMLTPNEKRHIRKSGNNEESIHIQLFDLLEGEPSYKEEKIKSAFESILKSHGKKSKISYVKNYLFEYILKVLRSYHSHKSETFIIYKYIEDIRFLLRRGNKDYLKNRFKQAKMFAEENELYTSLLEILSYQRDFYKVTGDSRAVFETNKEEVECLEKIDQTLRYRHLSDKVFLFLRKEWHSRKKEMNAELNEILKDPLIVDPNGPKTFAGQLMRLQILSNICSMKKETDHSFKHQKEMLELFEDSGKFKNEYYFFQYLKVLNNYLSRCLNLEWYKEFPHYFEKFDHYKVFPFENQALVFRCVIYFKLPYYLTNCMFEEAEASLPEIKSGLIVYDKFLTPANKMVLYSNLLTYCMIKEQYEEAQEWIEHIRQFENSNLRLDIQNYGRLAQLVTCIEIENFNTLLPSFKKSFTRKYKKEKRLFEFETIFFKAMDSLGKTAKHDSKRSRIFSALIKQLEPLKKDLSGKVAGIEEIYLWVEAKHSKKRIVDLLASKY